MINEKVIIFLLFLILVAIGLVGCTKVLNTSVCPDKTAVLVDVTETDSKNDKMQSKRSVTQTWKWGRKICNEK